MSAEVTENLRKSATPLDMVRMRRRAAEHLRDVHPRHVIRPILSLRGMTPAGLAISRELYASCYGANLKIIGRTNLKRAIQELGLIGEDIRSALEIAKGGVPPRVLSGTIGKVSVIAIRDDSGTERMRIDAGIENVRQAGKSYDLRTDAREFLSLLGMSNPDVFVGGIEQPELRLGSVDRDAIPDTAALTELLNDRLYGAAINLDRIVV